jgi:hypothetical protein
LNSSSGARATSRATKGGSADPNRLDDDQYLAQVITVSLETVKVVKGLKKPVFETRAKY